VKPRDLGLGVFALVCLAANTWPGYARFGNTIEPYVLGLPHSLAWVVGWILASFVALALHYALAARDAGRSRRD